MSAPRLTTERLILRLPSEADLPACSAYMASERARFTGGPVTEPMDQWRGFLAVLGHWALRGYGFFMVTLRDGTPVGRVGIINHVMWPEPELGWHIFEGMEGQGYAYEAALAARTWAASELGFTRLISQIHPENARSIALAERLGATLEGEGTLLGHPCLNYRHPEVMP
ncbi:GNAT family N-acetyltransferase [Litorisediminicola beolgyonensis]|uniref:GNAT family N-acetyltransferase n=1 Tax=Litorisediminicola beolgyonensis TaxID=1173614 RepID=A0ABW3ZNS1_9RHOB